MQMYARCRLKTMEKGDERQLYLVLWVLRGPSVQWAICLAFCLCLVT